MMDQDLKRRRTCQYGMVARYIRHIQHRQISNFDLTDKRVLELGAGQRIEHLRYWRGSPREYVVADISSTFLDLAVAHARGAGVNARAVHIARWDKIEFGGTYDLVLAFNVLEHCCPIDEALSKLRAATGGGVFLGAIPSEGDPAWRIGRRLLTWGKMGRMGMDPALEIAIHHPTCARCVMAGAMRVWPAMRFTPWPLPYPFAAAYLIAVNKGLGWNGT